MRFLLVVAFLGSFPMFGQMVRSFVSVSGLDTNPCTRPEPCRTFGQAIALTAEKGEVVALDSGGYGPFVVTKSITVIAPEGIHAAIAPTSGAAIVVDVNVAAAATVLRGLYLNGQGATTGISFERGATLYVENCVISNFQGYAIDAFNSFTSRLIVTGSVIRLNHNGVQIRSTAVGRVSALFDSTHFSRNAFVGLKVLGGLVEGRDEAVVRNCTFISNSDCVVASGGVIMVENSSISICVNGIIAEAEGTVRVSNTVVTMNDYGLVTAGGGQLLSYGNNKTEGNGLGHTFSGPATQN